ncbi:MAG: phosphodiester glycosidase family protein [Gemmatimonadetes bacterium]|nr:phosphodiester glycosidase family protein [Gemmatimonadota bacterium]
MMLRPLAAALMTVVAGAPSLARGQGSSCLGDTLLVRADSGLTSRIQPVAPGVTYQCLLDRRGPWAMHVVRVQLGGPVTIDAMRAAGQFVGRERVSDMAKRWVERNASPMIGINADFFNLQTGEVTGTHVEGGRWVKGITFPDSGGPPVDDARSQVVVLANGRVRFGRFELHGEVQAGARRIPLAGLNAYPPGALHGAVLVTAAYGDELAADTTARPRESRLALQQLADVGGVLRYRVIARATPGRPTPIPRDGAVLVVGPTQVAALSPGTRLTIRLALGTERLAPHAVVGGWGRLLADGRDVAAAMDREEGTRPSFSAARHPRTAVGTSADGRTLLLLVVDGRRRWSVGMSLVELAAAMRDLGAWDAINLDGGGSSTLWIDGRVVNAPSDATGERAVGNALWILRKPAKPTP